MASASTELPPILAPVAATTLREATTAPGSLLTAIADDPEALVYLLLNVGDGDTQCLLLPAQDESGTRRLAIVDVATTAKLPRLLASLVPDVLREPLGSPGQVQLLVATHPHADHIGGMADLLEAFPKDSIDQFWEPGYYFPSPSFHRLMAEIEKRSEIRRLQPTSGTSITLDSVKFTVVGPGVGLRNRFDTYGVDVNDASITLMVEYPAARLFYEPVEEEHRQNRRQVKQRGRRLLLGADAQFTSWAQATVDFPDLVNQQNPTLAKELRAATGRDYLAADVFKLSHHASKHGITLELVERVGAKYIFVSSVSGGGNYNFPHALAMDAVREARQPISSGRVSRMSDHDLGIHATGGVLDDAAMTRLGSIAAVIPRAPAKRIRLFRLMDGPRDEIRLSEAREIETAVSP